MIETFQNILIILYGIFAGAFFPLLILLIIISFRKKYYTHRFPKIMWNIGKGFILFFVLSGGLMLLIENVGIDFDKLLESKYYYASFGIGFVGSIIILIKGIRRGKSVKSS